MSADDGRSPDYASPPCFAHEVDPAYMGLPTSGDSRQEADVMRWRKAERKRLIEARLALSSQERRTLNQRILEHMASEIGPPEGRVVSAYWPFRGEPDLRGLLDRIVELGGQPALPVVVALGQPLIFRAWKSGEALDKGVWNIPVPRDSAAELLPDIVIAPVIGFDRQCYRLGFGGGFYDRTLAAMPKRPRVLGVGFELAEIETIYPQWHDIPMDVVVTENGAACRRETR